MTILEVAGTIITVCVIFSFGYSLGIKIGKRESEKKEK